MAVVGAAPLTSGLHCTGSIVFGWWRHVKVGVVGGGLQWCRWLYYYHYHSFYCNFYYSYSYFYYYCYLILLLLLLLLLLLNTTTT